MFEDKYKLANDSLTPSAEANERVIAAMRAAEDAKEAPVRRSTKRLSKGLTAAIAAVLCVLFVTPAIIGITKLAGGHKNSGGSTPQPGVLAVNLPASGVSADDYSEVFAKLKGSLVSYRSSTSGFWQPIADFFDFRKGDKAILEDSDAPAAAGRDDANYSGAGKDLNGGPETSPEDPDYSGTNVQVEGVDEADVVKTDGRYIYVLNGDKVTILTAAGAESEKLAVIEAADMPRHHNDAIVNFSEMYLCGGRLVIIATETLYSSPFYELPGYDLDSDDCLCYGGLRLAGSTMTAVHVFDLADAADPVLVSTVCQDGWYRDSRLTEGRLYLITNYTPAGPVFEEEPATYVPCTYDSEGDCRLTPAGDIHIEDDDKSNPSYVYVSTLDISDPQEFGGTLAILGYTDTIYCSGTNLYLTSVGFKDVEKEIDFDIDPNGEFAIVGEGGSNHGKLYTGTYYTEIYRIRIGGVQPVLEATGSFDGELLNQFSLDEYNGYLRAAVNRSGWSYVEVPIDGNADMNGAYYYDLKEGYEDDNAVCVLDMNMNVVSTLGGLGENEYIKSCRFMGSVAYVVTFRQTDPLFSIDLSDPTAPKVMGELKIPGFSEYLHSWNGGLLFGIGQMADEYTGGVQGLKLSMFDVSDKYNVKEMYCKAVDGVYSSVAEYSHKAILVAPDRGLIGFPADGDGYALYTFDEAEGFVKKGFVELPESDGYWWEYDAMRGMYIGDNFYVINRSGCSMYVIDLNTYMLSGTVAFN